jgi:hypothetical protein
MRETSRNTDWSNVNLWFTFGLDAARNALDIVRPHKKLGGSPKPLIFCAGRGTRTPDLLITNQLLYQLSYAGMARSLAMRA